MLETRRGRGFLYSPPRWLLNVVLPSTQEGRWKKTTLWIKTFLSQNLTTFIVRLKRNLEFKVAWPQLKSRSTNLDFFTVNLKWSGIAIWNIWECPVLHSQINLKIAIRCWPRIGLLFTTFKSWHSAIFHSFQEVNLKRSI